MDLSAEKVMSMAADRDALPALRDSFAPSVGEKPQKSE